MKYNPQTLEVTNKEGALVGTFDPETGTLRHMNALAPVVKGHIAAALKESGYSISKWELKGSQEEVSSNADSRTLPVMNARTTPPMPQVNPLQGDKTPAVVAWYKEHKPDEYEQRYAGRKFTV